MLSSVSFEGNYDAKIDANTRQIQPLPNRRRLPHFNCSRHQTLEHLLLRCTFRIASAVAVVEGHVPPGVRLGSFGAGTGKICAIENTVSLGNAEGDSPYGRMGETP